MGWYQNVDKESSNRRHNNRGSGPDGYDFFRWVLYIIAVVGFFLVEAMAIAAYGFTGVFVGLAFFIIAALFFVWIFS